VQVTVPPPAPPPVAPVANWADRIPTPGAWTYTKTARESIARYGVAGTDPVFMLRCDLLPRKVVVVRAGAAAGRLTLGATTGARAYQAQALGGAVPYVSVTIDPRDPQLDAMAFSRGRILIGLERAPDLVLPSWPEFARVVEDCR
jgi:hypothetical protein